MSADFLALKGFKFHAVQNARLSRVCFHPFLIVPLYFSPPATLRPLRLQTPYHLRSELITIERNGLGSSRLVFKSGTARGNEARGYLAL